MPGATLEQVLADVRVGRQDGAEPQRHHGVALGEPREDPVVPLRVGGGTRLKILEALSQGKPVLSTTIGAEGLGLEPGTNIEIVSDSPTISGASPPVPSTVTGAGPSSASIRRTSPSTCPANP